MKTLASTPNTFFTSRQPMTTLGKTIFGIQLFLAFGSFVGGYFTSGSIALLTLGTVNLLVAILIATGFLWAPVFGALITGSSLVYAVFVNPYSQYHLSHPKDPLFPIIVTTVALTALTFAAMLAAVAQNYGGHERQMPRWFSYILTGVIGATIGAILIGTISQPLTTSATTTASDGAIIIHLHVSSFSATSITVPKGGKLQFVDDSAITHILTYGSWSNQKTQLDTPSGAPALDNRMIAGGSFEIGPFATSGVYPILCTVHPGMQITVTVP